MVPVMAQGISANVQLDRKETYVGGQAHLNLTITGDNNAMVSTPRVAGLQFQQQGRSQQMRIINGNVSSNVSLSYLITPDKAGEFQRCNC